jgi:hypothetical protein
VSPTVNELRNEIREASGRFTREIDAQFTKEDLAAIASKLGHDVDSNQRPGKAEMRAAILWNAGLVDDLDPDRADGAFTKDQLQAIADALE